METQKENIHTSAQQALDELFAEGRLPFKLTAYGIETLGYDEYIVRFHDSRMPSVDITRHEGQSFKKLVRMAVLDRVSRLPPIFRAA